MNPNSFSRMTGPSFIPRWHDVPTGLPPFWREALDPAHLRHACRRVVQNRGGPGVDGMTTRQLPGFLEQHLPLLLRQIIRREYRPKPLKVVELEKPLGGGKRRLRIPTVLDRFVQQLLLQALDPIFDPTFSDFSFAYRVGRSAHDAIAQVQKYVQSGWTHIIHLDIEEFFDRVSRPLLFALLGKRVRDSLCLETIELSLGGRSRSSGAAGCFSRGLPQGSPLSPLCANIVLDQLDQALERRGRPFVRYADDAVLFVKTREEGQQELRWVKSFLNDSLRLTLNSYKTRMVRPETLSYLGFTFRNFANRGYCRAIAPVALAEFNARVAAILRPSPYQTDAEVKQRLESYMAGWMQSFGFCETPWVLSALRRRVRQAWKQRGAVISEAATASGSPRKSLIQSTHSEKS